MVILFLFERKQENVNFGQNQRFDCWAKKVGHNIDMGYDCFVNMGFK